MGSGCPDQGVSLLSEGDVREPLWVGRTTLSTLEAVILCLEQASGDVSVRPLLGHTSLLSSQEFAGCVPSVQCWATLPFTSSWM